MNNPQTLLITLLDEKVSKIIFELEALNLLKVIEKNPPSPKMKLSEKYRGVFTKEDAADFDKHINQMRNEWDNT